jgi:bisanhydrobacterioruberin hydratase
MSGFLKKGSGTFSKQQIATGIALAFHVSGLIAIGLFKSPLFIALTPLNLLVSALLIFYTQEKINAAFILFCLAAFGIGFGTEWIGVNTGIIFGDYTYGTVLGPKWGGVPYLIGLQWVIVIYCAGVCMAMLHQKLLPKPQEGEAPISGWLLGVSIVIDGALLALLFDWILEPVAVSLGYWTWAEGDIPWLNYATWWGVSALILIIFHLLPFRKHNLFAVHLLMIQVMFFLLMRTFGG